MCIVMVLPHIEPNTGLPESDIIAIIARQIFEWEAASNPSKK